METIQMPPDNEEEWMERHTFKGAVKRLIRRVWRRYTRLQWILIAGSCAGINLGLWLLALAKGLQ